MKVRILTENEEQKWSDFLKNHPLATVNQAPEWGHFQAKIPYRGKYWIVVVEENDKIIAGNLIIRFPLPKGYTWLYGSRGPVLDYKSPKAAEIINLIAGEVREIGKAENSVFFRIDPPLLIEEPEVKLPKFYSHHEGFYPEHTLILDLTASEEEILAQMKPKGRYNIKVALKNGVTIRTADPQNTKQFAEDIDNYHRIMLETTARDGFQGHRKGFYHDMVKTLSEAQICKMYIAEYQGKTVAALISTLYQDTAIYYYGVSSNEHRNVMAPYLLQWEAIKESKSLGLSKYDFLGISPPDDPKHELAGVSDFKLKFGGSRIQYHPAKDLPLKPLAYLAYRIYKAFKK